MSRVMIVDDENAVRTMLVALFEASAFSVLPAVSAASAIAALAEEQVDAVVTDLRMETPLAGFEVVKAAVAMVPRPVIVVLTAFPLPASEWKRSGADALIVKGSRIGELVKQVQRLLKAKSE